MAPRTTDTASKNIRGPIEDIDSELDDNGESLAFAKTKVECICPGCGKMHIMKMRWIGRGVPRKFCQNCRDRETPLDDDD